jgi:hypothetical protein
VLELAAALALVPWSQPVRFHPRPGWQSGASGTISSSYGPVPGVASPVESTAWMARGVRYRDRPAADPPNATLSRLRRGGIVVFAAVYQSGESSQRRIDLHFAHARRYPCCDGTYVPGGEYELDGGGPAGAYSVIVRIYFGSPPTAAMRAQVQRALNDLVLPRPG